MRASPMTRIVPASFLAFALLFPLAPRRGGLSGVAEAQAFHDYDLSLGAADEPACVVAAAPDGGVLVAWEEASGHIFTRLLRGALREPVDHGPGRDPVVVRLGEGFVLAFAEVTTVRVVQGDGETWGAPAVLAGGNREVTRPDLAAAPAGAGAELYLVWQENLTKVYFRQRQAGIWSDAEVVVDAEPVIGDAAPQVGPTLEEAEIVPRVYFYDGLARLRYKERAGGVWSGWVGIPGPNFALDGDLAWDGGLLHYVVSTEPDHACPCNHLHYTRELTDGTWTPIVDLDVVLDDFNWPQYPSIVVDAQSVPHVFWYQVFHDQDHQLTGEQMYYFVCEEDLWVDRSQIVADRVGLCTALALDPQERPVFSWAEGEDRASSVILRRFETSAGAPPPEERPREDPPRLRLAAGPVPARDRVSFSVILPSDPATAPAAARAATGAAAEFGELELFDGSGRLVRSWADDPLAAGGIVWDGRDAGGRRVAPGLYLARLTAGAERATARVLLAE